MFLILATKEAPIPAYFFVTEIGAIPVISNVTIVNDDPEFQKYMSEEEDKRKIQNSLLEMEGYPLTPQGRVNADVNEDKKIDDAEEKALTVATFYTEANERMVRRAPDQWFWMHNRWKTKRVMDD